MDGGFGDQVVILTEDEMQILTREIRGQGGFQSLLRDVRRSMHANALILTPRLARKITRYATRYGDGGFQRRLARIIEAAARP